MRQLLSSGFVILIVMAVAGTGCDSSTDPKTQGTLSLSSRYSPSTPPAQSTWKTGGIAGVDSIRVTRARFVLRDVTFKSDRDSIEFKSAPFILDLNLASVFQEVSVREVPFSVYERVEFDVHRVESTDVALLPTADRAAFNDFLAGDRYSIIVEGTVYRTPESDTSFVFRSRIGATQKLDLVPPLAISEANSVAYATLLISSGAWFTGPGGGILDPLNPNNESQISDNFNNSIRVFKDSNRDGTKDLN